MPEPEWVMEQWPSSATIILVRSNGMRFGKPTDEPRYYVSSLLTGLQALLRHVRDRRSIENSWQWVRDNGIQILSTLCSLAINVLRLAAT